MAILEWSTATLATFFPLLGRASKKESTLMMGFSYFNIPCTNGGTPVYILPKQIGVHAGDTVESGTVSSVFTNTGMKRSVYF